MERKEAAAWLPGPFSRGEPLVVLLEAEGWGERELGLGWGPAA